MERHITQILVQILVRKDIMFLVNLAIMKVQMYANVANRVIMFRLSQIRVIVLFPVMVVVEVGEQDLQDLQDQ
jgi:hypothetical protein